MKTLSLLDNMSTQMSRTENVTVYQLVNGVCGIKLTPYQVNLPNKNNECMSKAIFS